MTYRMFLDDERDPPEDGQDWLVFRSSSHAVAFMLLRGIPNYVSFDHDLGGDDTSLNAIEWMIAVLVENKKKRFFDFYVHSQNPIGKKNIEDYFKSFDKFAEENGYE